jgi:DNA end-binding protein Ku
MARPVWKGHVSFGLVNVPIVLYPAERRQERINFDLIDSRNAARFL